MSIFWPILLGFLAAMVIRIFDIKENVWHEKKRKVEKKEEKVETKAVYMKEDKEDTGNWAKTMLRVLITIPLILLVWSLILFAWQILKDYF